MNKNKYLYIVLPHRGLAEGKSRLSPVLDDAARFALNRDLLAHTIAALTHWLGTAQRCIVVSPSDAALELAREHGTQALRDEHARLNDAVAAGTAHALAQGARMVLIVPGDLPLLDEAALDSMAALNAPRTTVIAPDRHGIGTNALLISADVTAFAFGAHSFSHHKALAEARGDAMRVCTHEALAFDLDTPEDWMIWQRSGAQYHAASRFPKAKA